MSAPPTTAKGAKVAQAASVVRAPPVWPVGPIVSIIEKPQGDQVPVAPIEQAGEGEGDQQRLQGLRQQGTFVSKYMTQKTLRPE